MKEFIRDILSYRQGERIKDGTMRFSSFQAGSTSCLESSVPLIDHASHLENADSSPARDKTKKEFKNKTPIGQQNGPLPEAKSRFYDAFKPTKANEMIDELEAKKTLYLQAPLLYSRASFAPLLGRASFDAPTPNKLLVRIVELSLEKSAAAGTDTSELAPEKTANPAELFHYSLFLGLFVAFTYNKKEPPMFGAALSFWCIHLSFHGLLFRHIPNNLSNYNILTANAPSFYQISGTWSNHEGSILSWCQILCFYGFLLCYRGRPQSHNVSKRGGRRESLFYSFVLNFMKNGILSPPRYEQKSGVAPQLYTPFVLRTLVDSKLCLQRNRTFDGTTLFYASLYPERKISFAPLGARRSHGSREGKRTHPLVHLAQDDKERALLIRCSSIDEALGIALFFSPFLSVSPDPFVRNFFVHIELLAESNPVPQDPISALYPPCIYVGDVASAMGFGLCR
ncbi:hypothetical protein M9H77_23622 [Catharanthus roseus]|uniref:Uncharacterized protein n=1 Tax=Catharanthus roseus TaxID=4058 RepID=A0ACC0ATS5_CATRO|nr:hypothetical protein M9H77_23622 [Catharanthus roseus]